MTSPETRALYPQPENRSEVEPQSRIARTYAGQGSQFKGMGKALYENNPLAYKIYTVADRVSRRMGGPKITDLSFEADEETLKQTENAQPVILTHNLVCEQILTQQKSEGFTTSPWALAGISLGEYNTLVTSKAMTFENALKLVIIRGKLMAAADMLNPGGLLAVPINENDPRVTEALNNFHLEISLINTKNQIVVGGRNNDLQSAIEWLKENNIDPRFLIRLPVKGAFHTSLMQPAVEEFADILKHFPIKTGGIPIIANTTASPIRTPNEIRKELINQLTSTVRWRDTILYMGENGVDKSFEPGNDSAILSRMSERETGGKITRRLFPGVPSSAWVRSS